MSIKKRRGSIDALEGEHTNVGGVQHATWGRWSTTKVQSGKDGRDTSENGQAGIGGCSGNDNGRKVNGRSGRRTLLPH